MSTLLPDLEYIASRLDAESQAYGCDKMPAHAGNCARLAASARGAAERIRELELQVAEMRRTQLGCMKCGAEADDEQ